MHIAQPARARSAPRQNIDARVNACTSIRPGPRELILFQWVTRGLTAGMGLLARERYCTCKLVHTSCLWNTMHKDHAAYCGCGLIECMHTRTQHVYEQFIMCGCSLRSNDIDYMNNNQISWWAWQRILLCMLAAPFPTINSIAQHGLLIHWLELPSCFQVIPIHMGYDTTSP